MKYGFFDDKNEEYVITNPRTPYPWINYLGAGSFFSIISNTGGGYSFYKDARLRRITRYRYNNIPLDDGGKYFYINDGGVLWSPGWKPLKTPLDAYECRHGLGYTQISGQKNNLLAEALYFVPLDTHAEVQKLKLKNLGDKARHIKIHSFVEWAFWDAHDDMTNFQRNLSIGEVEVHDSAIYHKTEYRERRNHFAFYSVNTPVSGFDTDREAFLGPYNGLHEPDAVLQGKASNSIAHGWSPIASHFIEVSLQPGQEQEFIFLLGYVENDKDQKFVDKNRLNTEKARQLIARYSNAAAVELALNQLKQYWRNLLSSFQLQSNDSKLNRMVNTWNQYQCMITYFFSRSASYFESGIGRGMGFRDSNQDIIGMVHMAPKLARQRLLDLASTQMADGSAFHQYQPLTKRGNHEIGGDFNDDPLWLIFGVSAYIKETGDWSILDEVVPFDNNGREDNLFEHLRLAFYHVVNNLGPHGLPLIGRADWNDCLNLNCFSENPGESFQTTQNKKGETAESIFIAGMFVCYGEEFARLSELSGRILQAKEARHHINQMRVNIVDHGWDGEWFLRAYDYFGQKVGSHENREGQIFVETQGMCVMAGIGHGDDKAKKALQSVEKRLATPYGIVLTNPAFTEYDLKLGEITSYPPGYKENAGIFCHNNPWIIIAEAMLGHNEKAFDYYRRIAPAYLEDISDLHRTEPYVYSQMIAGKDAARPGEAKNSWLTGTAAWNYFAVTQYILGIVTDYEGLRIKPRLPETIQLASIVRKFRGATYHITIENKGGNKVRCFVDGIECPACLPHKKNASYQVKVILEK